ncbi:DUF6456 domain-containing protein [Sphingomonas antarctica]|uniref:DUF6456 domain-containing protein n=1 Tax=Sphingomonas antarctica TaxID=2040274 RepID=UPI0039E7F2D9
MRDLVEVGVETNGAPAILAAMRRASRKTRGRSVTVNRAESPLSWLRARDLIDARSFEAGERLRADYERAALAPGVTMRWDPARAKSTGGGDPTTLQIDARVRFDRAIDRVGPGLSDVLWRVVCACEPLPAAERALGWPTRSGRLVLTLALDRLADAYGLSR